MKQYLSRLLTGVGVLILVVLLTLGQIALDFRDWQDSDTWLSTPSTRLVIHPRASTMRYHYRVAGSDYQGDRSHFFVLGPEYDRRHLAWLRAHREAESVLVYYDPDAPGRSVMVREVENELWLRWGIGIAFIAAVTLLPLVFFASLWWWLWRQLRH